METHEDVSTLCAVWENFKLWEAWIFSLKTGSPLQLFLNIVRFVFFAEEIIFLYLFLYRVKTEEMNMLFRNS